MAVTEVNVAFVLEQHLGHRTYADNLRSHMPAEPCLAVAWIPVRYEADLPPIWRRSPPSVRSRLSGRAEVRDGLRAVDHDVVVFNTQVPAALGGTRARQVPYVVVTDVTPIQYDRMADGYGHRPDRFPPLRWWKHRVNRRVFAEAAYCVGWSSWVRDSLIDDYGVESSSIRVIPPGVDTARWAPPARETTTDGVRILFVGGDFHRKGGPRLVRALAELPEECELLLVTRTAGEERFGDLASRITVIDDLQPNDARLLELFHGADVFVLPSEAETFGIAAVEASAAGLPVVASRVGGLPDIVQDAVTGALVEPADDNALVAALRRLVDDEALRRRMGAAARRHAEVNFDAGVNAGRLVALAVDAAGGQSARSS